MPAEGLVDAGAVDRHVLDVRAELGEPARRTLDHRGDFRSHARVSEGRRIADAPAPYALVDFLEEVPAVVRQRVPVARVRLRDDVEHQRGVGTVRVIGPRCATVPNGDNGHAGTRRTTA